MNRAWWSLGLITLVLAVLCLFVGRAPRSGPQAQAGLMVGEPIVYRNLTIFPVVAQSVRDQDRFITLDEGLQSGLVEVLEMSAGHPGDSNGEAAIPQPAVSEDEDPFGIDVEPTSEPAPQPCGAQTANADPVAQQAAEQEAELPIELPNVEQAEPFLHDMPHMLPAQRHNEVNRLLVINRSDKPLYLMPGEILLGGDQDRTIGQELVIAPGGTPTPVHVFCVEHGRWGQRSSDELAGLITDATANSARGGSVALSADISAQFAFSAAEGQTAAAASTASGKFIGSVGSLSKKGRLAVQGDKEQSKVWEEVASENSKGGVQSGSGAFTGNYAESQAVERLEPYIESLRKAVAETDRVVGVIVAVNGKIESLDVFESTPLFRKLWPKLLKSYALDAANAADAEADAVCTRQQAVAFFDKASQSKSDKHESSGGVAVAAADTDDLILFSARETAATSRPFVTSINPVGDAAVPSAAMGGFGGAIHSAGYAK